MLKKILRTNKNHSGFTLLEMLIAVSLMSIGLLAAASMQGVAINANAHANRLSVANNLSQQVVDELISLSLSNGTSYALLTTALSNITYNRMYDPAAGTSTASSVSVLGAGTFTAKYSISPDTPISGTTQIDVNVYWNNGLVPVVSNTTYKTVK